MNKKEIQRIHEESSRAQQPAALPAPVPAAPQITEEQITEAVGKALENRMVDVRTQSELVVKDSPWFQLYCAVVGGQSGWLVSASDTKALQTRLDILTDITTSAANHARNIKKIGK